MKPCSVEGCDKPAASERRHCWMHIHRMRRHGSFATVETPTYHVRDVEARFWEKVEFPEKEDDDACWVWKGGLSRVGGYGVFMRKKGVLCQATHVALWLWSEISVPRDMWALHHCDNPPCVKPFHLFVGTPMENTQDMAQKGRGRRGPDGKPRW